MRRREFIAGLGSTAAALPLSARAQQPAMPVVGWLRAGELPTAEYLAAFRQGLNELGYIEGRNVKIELRNSEQYDRLPDLASEFARRPVTAMFADNLAAAGYSPVSAAMGRRRAAGNQPAPAAIRVFLRGFCADRVLHHADTVIIEGKSFRAWWAAEGREIDRARRALRLQRIQVSDREDPFAAVIRCTADPAKADKRTRSKWSRAMRYAAAYKPDAEPLEQFVRRKGGINEYAACFSRCREVRGCRDGRHEGDK